MLDAARSKLASATRAVRRRVHIVSIRAEHLGFVAVAAIDTFNIHSALFFVSVLLLIAGLAVEFFGGPTP